VTALDERPARSWFLNEEIRAEQRCIAEAILRIEGPETADRCRWHAARAAAQGNLEVRGSWLIRAEEAEKLLQERRLRLVE
jgi:hypothetical protein